MRLVVDTNVFVSAALKYVSSPGDTVRWIQKYGGLLKTGDTEQEIMEVLQRPRIAPKIAPFVVHDIRGIFAAAELVTIAERVAACRDPKDDKFLELTMNGRRTRSCQVTPTCWRWMHSITSRSSRRQLSFTRKPCDPEGRPKFPATSLPPSGNSPT